MCALTSLPYMHFSLSSYTTPSPLPAGGSPSRGERSYLFRELVSGTGKQRGTTNLLRKTLLTN